MTARSAKYLYAALGILVAAPALAQSPPPPADEGASPSSDIVVNARRIEERLQDVPISMTVFDQKALSDRNIADAQDLVNYTPSLSTNTIFGNENATYSLRGFFQEAGTAPSVGIYFAEVVAPRGFAQGIPAGDGAGPGSFFDLRNVQVLNGPQGTLFGRNTTGGAILLVPQKPTDRLEGYAEGTIGNYDMRRLQGVINIPLSDGIRARIGVDHLKRDGYLINDSGIGPRDFNNSDYVAVRASLVADLTDNLENYTIFSFANSENNGSIQKISHCYPDGPASPLFMAQACGTLTATNAKGFYHTVNTMPDPISKLKTWQVINTTTWQASDTLTVKNIASYARLTSKFNTPLYGTQFFYPTDAFGLGMGDVPVDFVHVRTRPGGLMANQQTFTEELQLQGSAANGALTWQAGLFYEDSRPKSEIGSQPVLFLSCSDPDNFQCIDISAAFGPPSGALVPNLSKTYFNSKALYAQASYDLSEQFTLTGGFRYTWDHMRAIGRQLSYTFPDLFGANQPVVACALPGPSLPDCEIRPSRKSSAPTWLLGIDYKPNDDILLYAKYSRGYRTGGVKTDVPSRYQTWAPEKVDTFEIGAKTSFGGPVRGNFNVTAFYNDFSNQQINFGYQDNLAVPGSIAPGAGPINAGKSRIWGIEIDARIEPIRGLVLTGGYSYLNTRIKEIDPVTLPATDPYVVAGAVLPGDALPFTPRHKLNLAATYTLPLDESIGDVSLGVNYSYVGGQIASYALRDPALVAFYGKDLGVLQARNLVDLYFNWRKVGGGPIDLGAFVTNLTQQKYFTSITSYSNELGFNTANVGQPRMFGVKVRYNFGQ